MRVLICDDHRLFGDSLALVLQAAGHHIVSVVEAPAQAADVLARHEVDVCVMDLQYADGDGLDGIAEVAGRHPGVRVIVLSGHLDDERIDDLRAAGVWAWAVKRGPLDDVVRLVGDDVGESLAIAEVDRWQADPLGRFLTHREREVLEAVARGESTTVLAIRFGVSHATIRTHVQNILSKLGVHARLEAVAYAVSRSLVVPDQRRQSSSA